MKSLIFLLITFIFVGCQTVPYQGTARDVKRRPQREGVIAIPSQPRDEDRQKAELKMQQNCNPKSYEVLEEGEVVVGQKTDSSGRETNREANKHKVGSLFGVPITSGDDGGVDSRQSAVTTSLKEWQIQYKCVAANNGKKNI